MAPKQRNTSSQTATPSNTSSSPAAPARATTPSPPTLAAKPPSSSKPSVSAGGVQSFDKIVSNVLSHYVETTPQRTKLLDAFMAFLVAVGALQFVYCVLAGNYVRFSSFEYLCSCYG
jgi:oligosaccharyltransferase complex subunit epsilon